MTSALLSAALAVSPSSGTVLASTSAATVSASTPAGAAARSSGDVIIRSGSTAPQSQADDLDLTGEEPLGPGGMTLSDLRMNFATVVETFVADRSPGGFWLYEDAATKTRFKLKLDSVDSNSLKPAGDSRYAGRATLRELAGPRRLQFEFTVDFAGTMWKVRGIRLLEKAPPKRR